MSLIYEVTEWSLRLKFYQFAKNVIVVSTLNPKHVADEGAKNVVGDFAILNR